jgi:HlyD family secretion protein
MNAEVAVEIARREDVVTIPNAAVVSMRDAAAAGAVLGLSEEAVRNALRGGRGGPEGARNAPDSAHAASSRPDSARGAGARPAEGAAAPSAECAALREKARGGDWSSLSEADRAKMRECMPQMGGRQGQGRMGEGRMGQGRGGDRQVRPGVVFVRTAGGAEPRRVMLGVNDWDHTEVVQGLEPGDSVILISVARLQQQQQQMVDRMRQMQGGPFPGAQPQGGRR